MIWTLYRGILRPQLQPVIAEPRESRAGWVLLVVSVVAVAWGMAGVRACVPTAEAAPELGPCSPVGHLCSVDEDGQTVNRWTYACPWGEEVRDLPWPCPEMRAERPPSDADIIPALVVGGCYLFTDICADGFEKDWLVACTGPLGFQWAEPVGKVGEVCDG